MTFWQKVIDGLIVAGTGAILGGVFLLFRWLTSTKKCLDSVLHNQSAMSGMLCRLMEIKGPTLSVQRATLDILVGAKINGNVKRAYAALDKADKVYAEAVSTSIQESCQDDPRGHK